VADVQPEELCAHLCVCLHAHAIHAHAYMHVYVFTNASKQAKKKGGYNLVRMRTWNDAFHVHVHFIHAFAKNVSQGQHYV
jgi:hypothetical protein